MFDSMMIRAWFHANMIQKHIFVHLSRLIYFTVRVSTVEGTREVVIVIIFYPLCIDVSAVYYSKQ